MLSVAVCDDVVLECADLARRIREVLGLEGIGAIVKRFFSGRDLLEAGEAFDLAFLDIRMPGMDGMELAKRLRGKRPDMMLIFVTSASEYVFEAYDVEAFHYLVKPVPEEKLRRVLLHAAGKISGREAAGYLLVSLQKGTVKVRLKDIVYMEARGRLVDIHCAQETVTVPEALGRLEKKLEGRDFFRCHKGYLINLRFVDGFQKTQITMENGDVVLLARRRYDDFAREIMNFMKREGGIL